MCGPHDTTSSGRLEAARAANVAATVALIRSGLDVNARDRWQPTPAHYAVSQQPRALGVYTAGADLRVRNNDGFSPLDYPLALTSLAGKDAFARVLTANGVRLCSDTVST